LLLQDAPLMSAAMQTLKGSNRSSPGLQSIRSWSPGTSAGTVDLMDFFKKEWGEPTEATGKQ